MASLFDPITIGDIPLKNRIVMAPLTRNRSPGAVPNTLNVTYYEQRATAGLLITEGTAITQQGQGYADVPGLYTPEALEGWRKVTDAVHAKGGRIVVQMWHVGRVSHNSLQPDGLKPVVLTTHRRESFGGYMTESLRILRRFVEVHDDVALMFPVHPNPVVVETTRQVLGEHPRIHLLEPLNYEEFVLLLSRAWLVVSDSGGVQEEAPTLGKPLLILRENTERPEAVECGVARLVGEQPDRLATLLDEVRRPNSWIDQVGKASGGRVEPLLRAGRRGDGTPRHGDRESFRSARLRVRDADGVAHRNLERAHLHECCGDPGDAGRVDRALERTAESGGEIGADAHPQRLRPGGDGPVRLQRVVYALVDVAPAEGLRGRGEDGHFRYARSLRPLETGEVGNERRVSRTGRTFDARKNIGGVGHLRHPLRADERRHFHHRQPGKRKPVHERDLVGRRDRGLLVLQAVARADFDDGDAAGSHGGVMVRAR